MVVRLAARYGGIGQAAGLGDALIVAFGPEPAVARCAERLESAARLAARGSPRLEAHLWSTRSSFARLPPDQRRRSAKSDAVLPCEVRMAVMVRRGLPSAAVVTTALAAALGARPSGIAGRHAFFDCRSA
ncbi:MAG TPA: hypothetical protein VG125_22860 [Pirellulales bacterium]|nr:hypothetical protein [Pirellulales bacterium]